MVGFSHFFLHGWSRPTPTFNHLIWTKRWQSLSGSNSIDEITTAQSFQSTPYLLRLYEFLRYFFEEIMSRKSMLYFPQLSVPNVQPVGEREQNCGKCCSGNQTGRRGEIQSKLCKDDKSQIINQFHQIISQVVNLWVASLKACLGV